MNTLLPANIPYEMQELHSIGDDFSLCAYCGGFPFTGNNSYYIGLKPTPKSSPGMFAIH